MYLLFNNKKFKNIGIKHTRVGGTMNKKIFSFAALLVILGILASGISFASISGGSSSSSAFPSNFDVSIDRVAVNSQVVSQSQNNVINDADVFFVVVDATAVQNLSRGHIEATLRGRQSGNAVADSTLYFDITAGTSFTSFLTLTLNNDLKRENEFDLKVKIVDVRGNSREKNYGLVTRRVAIGRGLDVSLDRVRVNGNVVAVSSTNFIDGADTFDVLVDFTALENLNAAHIEAVLKDLNTGLVVADATPNFDLAENSQSSKSMKLQLLDGMKKSGSFELAIKVADAEGNSIRQVYGLHMKRGAGNGISADNLGISVDGVEIESKNIAEDESNFIVISKNIKHAFMNVRLTALENIKGVHVDAILTFGNGDSTVASTPTFDMSKDQNVVKSLDLPLITGFDQGSFNLKLKVTDTEGDSIEKSYGLKLSEQKFPFSISSISLSPDGNVEAGKLLVVSLRLANSGVVPLDGMAVKLSIPEIGVLATKFIDVNGNNKDKSEIKQDFVLKIPDTAEAGTYTLKAEITSKFNDNVDVKALPVDVIAGKSQSAATDSLIINVPITRQDIKNNGAQAIYPIALMNDGTSENTYTLLLDGSGWADLKLSDSSTFVLSPQESKMINLYASTTSNALGEQPFLVTVKSKGRSLQQISFKANVIPAAKGIFSTNLKNLIEIFLIVATILLAAVGMYFGAKNYVLKSDETAGEEISNEIPDSTEGEAYY